MRAQQQPRDHGSARQEQKASAGYIEGSFFFRIEIKDDPAPLVAEPECPSGSLQHPEPAQTACACQAIRGKSEKGGEHEHAADDIAHRRERKSAGAGSGRQPPKHGRQQRQPPTTRDSLIGLWPCSTVPTFASGFSPWPRRNKRRGSSALQCLDAVLPKYCPAFRETLSRLPDQTAGRTNPRFPCAPRPATGPAGRRDRK